MSRGFICWRNVLCATLLAGAALCARAQTAPAPQSVDVVSAPSIALILPSAKTPFARAAEAVRAGFFAAHKASGDAVAIQMIDIDERAESLAGALATARDRRVSAVVGPLTRVQVNHLIESGRAGAPPAMPVVTLNYPEWESGAPPTLLAFGLAIEHEARRMVQAVLAELDSTRTDTSLTPRFLVVGGQSALSKRATAVCADALREGGERATVVTPTLDKLGLDVMAAAVTRGEFVGAFLALDAREAMVVRARLPKELPLFATSQVHAGGAEAELTALELEGVRFADMPWLLEPDHTAVMVYPRPAEAWGAELQRLYALGIDAYRLAVAWMGGRSQFDLDGVTGQLRVDRAHSARVERMPSFAVFRSGKVERLDRAMGRVR
jgi:outer membrane PBP1 activator LpoA protein